MARGSAVRFSGKRMQEIRQEAHGGRGVSRAQLARTLDVTERLLLAYETEARRPDPQRIRELAVALDVTPRAFTAGDTRAWTLAELRSASGWRAVDISRELGISLRSYRRVETEGLVHPKRYGLMGELAGCLEADLEDIDICLSNVPRCGSVLARPPSTWLYSLPDTPPLANSLCLLRRNPASPSSQTSTTGRLLP